MTTPGSCGGPDKDDKMLCDCADQITLYDGSDDRVYESQTDGFRCGPVAIRNALRWASRPAGPASNRHICQTCGAQPTRANGFGGTMPANMTAAIQRVWPAIRKVAVGAAATKEALLSPGASAFILLYTGRKTNGRRFYHYVFVWRDRGRFFAQNEMEREEYVVRASQLDTEYLEEYTHEKSGVQMPQVWVMS